MRHPVLVYDYNPTGHCPGWLYLTATGFCEGGADVRVYCRTNDPRLEVWVGKMKAAGCRIEDIPETVVNHAEHAATEAHRHNITRIFFPNFDSIIYEMGKRRARNAFDEMDVGGIWLRPDLSGVQIGWLRFWWGKLARTRTNKLARRHARAVANNRRGLQEFLPPLSKVARTRLFFTNREAAAETAALLGAGAVAMICDPWLARATAEKATARAKLGIPHGRVVMLHAGTSRPEKGLKDACDALLGCSGAVYLLRAGRVDSTDAPALERLRRTGAALVLDYFVDEEELALCYAASDWVLIPYRNQKESSGLLIHAAANAVPVIASDYGVIGRHVRRYRLGRLFAHRDTEELGRLCAEIAVTGEHDRWDSTGMEEFARMNSPEMFRRTVIEDWLTNTAGYREGSR